jgi:cytidyltransferase-like protein
MESLNCYYAFVDEEGEILAGAGLAGDVLKCLAVSEAMRSEGLLVPLVSRILSEHQGPFKVFTKPEYQAVFESLGFRLLAAAPLAVLMENGRGLEKYCEYLRAQAREGRCGVVVMNANPFTLGHQYLLQEAAKQVDHLFVIPVKEDLSDFPYAERKAMIMAGSASVGLAAKGNYFSQGFAKNQFPLAIANLTHTDAGITVLEGSDYVISAATFPTYFLKDLSQAAETHMRLDLDIYSRWIAPALGASVRFVGSEPFDALTNRYNQLIPDAVVIPRLDEISASRVRAALERGSLREASALCPATTRPYLLAALAERALRLELDTPGKPGLVCPESSGAHRDMNYDTMRAGIRAIRPFFAPMALAGSVDELRTLGIQAEEAMLQATGGVNTHRGAIFCLGLALNARGDSAKMAALAASICGDNHSRGARSIALDGYKQLFEEWLPYYRDTLGLRPRYDNVIPSEASELRPRYDNVIPSEASESHLKLLLRIMSTLDDTCVIKRVGVERAQQVKEEAREMADQVGHDGDSLIGGLCKRYAAEGISPGGAADMLALTIFIHSILS